MDTNHSKLKQQKHEPGRQEQRQTAKTEGQEFDSAESMLRFDAARTEPPVSLPERLAESVENQKKRAGSWWNRITGKDRD